MLPLFTSILLTAAPSLAANLAPTGPEVTAYDQTLTPITGTLVSVTDRRVVLTVEGRERTIDNAAAIIARLDNPPPSPSTSTPTPTNPAPTPRIQFDLTDGQRWITPLANVRFDAERILTTLSPAAAPLKLDQVRRITFGIDPAPLAAVPTADTAHLRSGDTLTGFVASITTTGDKGEFAIALESAASGTTTPATPRTIKHDTLRSLTLTNPPAATSAVRVWLTDGQRLAASSSFSGAEWTLTPGQKDTSPIKFAADALRAALLAPGVITPLSSLEFVAMPCDTTPPDHVNVPLQDPAHLGPDADLGLREIMIPEPQNVYWYIPPEVLATHVVANDTWLELPARLNMTIALREDCLAWGNCDVVLRFTSSPVSNLGGINTELLQTTLSAANPTVSVSTQLPPSKPMGVKSRTDRTRELDNHAILTLEVRPGKHGPVQDRIVIRNAMLGTGK